MKSVHVKTMIYEDAWSLNTRQEDGPLSPEPNLRSNHSSHILSIICTFPPKTDLKDSSSKNSIHASQNDKPVPDFVFLVK